MISFDWISPIILAGSVVGLFLSAVLFSLKGASRLSRRVLGAFLAAFALSNFASILSHVRPISHRPAWPSLFAPVAFLVGPLLLLYVRSLTGPAFRLRLRHAVHAIPFAVAAGVFFLAGPPGNVIHSVDIVLRSGASGSPFLIRAYPWFRIAVVLVYLGLSALALQRHARTLRDRFSALDRISLAWLRLLVAAYALGFAVILIPIRTGIPDPVLHVLESLLIVIIGIRGLLQPEIFAPGAVPAAAAKPAPKYARSSLTPEQAERAERLIIAIMENDRIYLDDDLSLTALADKAGLPPAHVSQVINERLKKSFYHFVNGFRIEEAKRMLRDPRRSDRKILAVALEAGFSGKVVFNRIFKRFVGMTPSEYKVRPPE